MLEAYKNVLIPLFQKLKKLQQSPLQERLLSLEIQEVLLKRIVKSEKRIQILRSNYKSAKTSLSQRDNDKHSSKKLKRRLKLCNTCIERQKRIVWIYRTIGDSIAFIYGDRWDLKQYVMKEDAGFIAGKVGTKLEKAILKKSYQLGHTTLMNDLTNTIRHGDISVFRPDLWPDGGSPFLLIEAKSGNGGNKKRAARQVEAIKNITDYIYSDDESVDKKGRYRVAYDTPPKHNFSTVEELKKALPPTGWLIRQPEPGLLYLMIDSKCRQRQISQIFSEISQDFKNLFFMSVNQLKGESNGYYPFPLCFEPHTLYEFYNGDFVLFVIVDMSHINKVIAEKHLAIRAVDSDTLPWEIISTLENRNEAQSFVGGHIVGRLAAEFLSLEWIINNAILGALGVSLRNKLNWPNRE